MHRLQQQHFDEDVGASFGYLCNQGTTISIKHCNTVTGLHVSLFGCIMTEVFVLAKKTVVVRSIAGVETCITVPGQGIGVVFDLVWLSVKAVPQVVE